MGRSDLIARPTIKANRRPILAVSAVTAPVLLLGRLLMPLYLRFVLRFQSVEIHEPQIILAALREFQQKKTRLIVAFRHPYGDEPQLLFHAFANCLPRLARHWGITLERRPHLRMVHDYAVSLWGDALIRFVLPRAGAVPVYHARFDPESLRQIRDILLDDPNPLGLAPEGQISYHSETLPRIEQGAVRMGFWCARDLAKAGRTEHVHVLPLSVYYRYNRSDLRKVQAALARLEKSCGLAPVGDPGSSSRKSAGEADLMAAIERIENRVLAIAEDFYGQNVRSQKRHPAPAETGQADSRQQRWTALLLAALNEAERILGISHSDKEIIARVYRIRQESWNRIYPEHLPDSLSQLERALAHRRAGEAWHAMRHMEFVDLMSYHDTGYLQSRPLCGSSFDRIVETVINLEDLAARLRGGNITTRPNRIRKKAVLIPAPCLDLTERLSAYRQDARETVSSMTEALRQSLLHSLEDYCNDSGAS